MADQESLKVAEEEYRRKYGRSESIDSSRLMQQVLCKKLNSSGKQYYDSADYNMSKVTKLRNRPNLKIPTINTEHAFIQSDKSPPNPRLSPTARRLSASSVSSTGGSIGLGDPHLMTFQAPKETSISSGSESSLSNSNLNNSINSPLHGWVDHHSLYRASNNIPLHINTDMKPVRRLSSASSCGEPSPLATEGGISVAFKRPPISVIPGIDHIEPYHGDAIQISMHSPHSPCNISAKGKSPISYMTQDSNRQSPIMNRSSQEEEFSGEFGKDESVFKIKKEKDYSFNLDKNVTINERRGSRRGSLPIIADEQELEDDAKNKTDGEPEIKQKKTDMEC